MSLTITLDDELVDKLTKSAVARDVSVEEWAVEILRTSTNGAEHRTEWEILNQRRLELIAREYRGEITPEECHELESLQAASARASEPHDLEMLSTLDEVERRESKQ